jgi:hypothetical protein
MSSKVVICGFYNMHNYHCQEIIDNSAFYHTRLLLPKLEHVSKHLDSKIEHIHHHKNFKCASQTSNSITQLHFRHINQLHKTMRIHKMANNFIAKLDNVVENDNLGDCIHDFHCQFSSWIRFNSLTTNLWNMFGKCK